VISLFSSKKRPSSGSDRLDWHSELIGVTGYLEQLSVSTEKEFLDLGESLQEIYRRAKVLSQLSSQVAERLSGTEMNQGIDGLRELLEQIKNQSRQSISGAGIMSAILGRFDDIRLHLGYFERTIRNLQALCSMLRIESARLGECESNFSTVSDEVKKLAAHMALKSQDLKDHLDTITTLIRQHLKRITEFENKEQGQARLILDNTSRYIDSITKRYNLSSSMLSDNSNRWVHISKSIGEVVMSLQFHDITRQRIEHVCEALGEVNHKMGVQTAMETVGAPSSVKWQLFGRKGQALNANRRTLAGMAAIPCELQLAQLKHAQEDLLTALNRIHINLGEIASGMVRMSADTLQATGAEGGNGRSFLSELENGLSLLTNAIGAYAGIHRERAASLKHVTGTVGDMSSFISEIVHIGINMRIIALNACIHAAHVGDGGMALGVLAEAIHQLSANTSKDIATMSENLSAIVGETEKLTEGETAESSQNADTERMEDRISDMMAPLRQMDDEQATLLTRIDADSKSLTLDMEETLMRLDRHEHFKKGLDGIILKIEDLVKDMHSEVPSSHQDTRAEEFAKIKDRYTMEQERQIHESVMGPAAVSVAALSLAEPLTGNVECAVAAMETASTGSDQEDLGDNIELF